MMRAALLGAVAVLAISGAAQAYPVTYRLTDTTYNAVAMDAQGLQNGDPFGSFQLTIDSAAVARGSFTLSGANNGPGIINSYAGDLADFISATTPLAHARGGSGESAGPSVAVSSFNTQLRFDASGAATGRVEFNGATSGLSLFDNLSLFSGVFGGDGTGCEVSPTCTVTGRLVTLDFAPSNVPEPVSITLLLTGLLGFAASRRGAEAN